LLDLHSERSRFGISRVVFAVTRKGQYQLSIRITPMGDDFGEAAFAG